MGFISYDTEKTSSIPPAKMYKAFFLDFDTLVPKIMPQAVRSVEIVEQSNASLPGEFQSMKIRVDGMDKENFTYGYTVIESDALIGALESFSYETKIEGSPDGGSIFKSSGKFYTKGDAQIKEEQIKSAKEKAFVIFNAIEAYLLANPDA